MCATSYVCLMCIKQCIIYAVQLWRVHQVKQLQQLQRKRSVSVFRSEISCGRSPSISHWRIGWQVLPKSLASSYPRGAYQKELFVKVLATVPVKTEKHPNFGCGCLFDKFLKLVGELPLLPHGVGHTVAAKISLDLKKMSSLAFLTSCASRLSG